jgi:hypothetical protein
MADLLPLCVGTGILSQGASTPAFPMTPHCARVEIERQNRALGSREGVDPQGQVLYPALR